MVVVVVEGNSKNAMVMVLVVEENNVGGGIYLHYLRLTSLQITVLKRKVAVGWCGVDVQYRVDVVSM